MKRICGSHYFIHLFTNSTSQHVPVATLSLFESKLVCSVLWRAGVGIIYSSIAQNSLIDQYRSRQNVRLLGNQICLSLHKYFLVQHPQDHSHTIPRMTSTSAVIISYPFGAGGLFS